MENKTKPNALEMSKHLLKISAEDMKTFFKDNPKYMIHLITSGQIELKLDWGHPITIILDCPE